MIHQHSDVKGKITVTLEAEDWVWLCTLLVAVKNDPYIEEYDREDTEHALSTLQAFEAGV